MKMQLATPIAVFLLVSVGTVLAVPRYAMPQDDTSCVGRCNAAYNASYPCQCNTACVSHGDCCADYTATCTSGPTTCQNRCTIAYNSTLPCQCDSTCQQYTDCCADYTQYCSVNTSTVITDQKILDTIGTVLAVPRYAMPQDDTSCVGRCNDAYNASYPCQCNTACVSHGDCCADYTATCTSGQTSCQNRCTIAYDATLPCQCNSQCQQFADCCTDYTQYCSSSTITDQEILDISSQIWTADVNRLAVGLDWQGTTVDGGTTDNAPGPLCTGIPPEINTNPQYVALQALYDDYIADENFPEDMSPTDVADIDAFMTQITSTQSMQLVNTFLASKSLAPSDPVAFQAQIKDIWFTLYVRQGVLGSSGGEHVLLGEIQSGNSINGLHNWVRFCTQESQGQINYIGYVANEDLGGAWLIRNPFYWGTSYKPIGGFFIGTSPAFDLSIFTLCFYARPNAICNVQLNGISVPIQTYTLAYNGGTYVGSAYPAF